MGNRKDALRGLGIMASEVSGSRLIRVPHTALFCPEEADPEWGWAHEKRSTEPPDEALVLSFAARFEAGEQSVNEKIITVGWEPIEFNGQKLLLVQDGNRRAVATEAAAQLLRRRGVLGKDGTLPVLVEFVDRDDRVKFLAARTRLNTDPTRKPDTGSVLAYRVRQLLAMGQGAGDIAPLLSMPKATVEALERWSDVAAVVRKKIDAGEVPIGLLPEILRHPKAEQEAVAVKLAAEGVKTAKGATRRRNKAKNADDPWARRMSPKKLVKVADALTDENGAPVANRKISDAARYVAAGMRIAAGVNVESVLDDLPAAIVGIIQEARAAKGVRS